MAFIFLVQFARLIMVDIDCRGSMLECCPNTAQMSGDVMASRSRIWLRRQMGVRAGAYEECMWSYTSIMNELNDCSCSGLIHLLVVLPEARR